MEFLVIFVVFALIICIATQECNKERLEGTKRNVSHYYGNCKYSFYDRTGKEYLLITKDNTVIFSKDGKRTEININDIIKVDLKYHIVEKHKQKILTIMPTFDKTTALSRVEVDIFTFSDNDFSYKFDPFYYEDVAIKLEKFKYLIEDIKSKSSNN